jgi:hypothetical protein
MPLHELASKEPYYQRRPKRHYCTVTMAGQQRSTDIQSALIQGFLRSSDSAQRHQITLGAPLHQGLKAGKKKIAKLDTFLWASKEKYR